MRVSERDEFNRQFSFLSKNFLLMNGVCERETGNTVHRIRSLTNRVGAAVRGDRTLAVEKDRTLGGHCSCV
jgi:hypothetical protein